MHTSRHTPCSLLYTHYYKTTMYTQCQFDQPTDVRADRQTDGQMDRSTDKRTYLKESHALTENCETTHTLGFNQVMCGEKRSNHWKEVRNIDVILHKRFFKPRCAGFHEAWRLRQIQFGPVLLVELIQIFELVFLFRQRKVAFALAVRWQNILTLFSAPYSRQLTD